MSTGVEVVDMIREQTDKDLFPANQCHVYGDPGPGNPIIIGPLWDAGDQEVVMALTTPGDDLFLLYPLTGTWNQQLEDYRANG